jgi:DNA-binding beta-propeller fold protein YncE
MLKMGRKALFLGAMAMVWIAAGCGQKLDPPPQPIGFDRIPEPGTYNLFTVWGMDEPTDIATRDSHIYVIHGNRELRAYLNYRTSLAQSPIVGDFNGLIQPVRVAVAKRDSIFVIVADAGDMTVKRYYFLGGDPLFTFSDSTWTEFSGLAADSRLNVFVADATRDTIQVYDERGAYVRLLSDRGTGSGFVISPHGLAHNGAMVIVADTGKNWVQRLKPDTTYIPAIENPIGIDEELTEPEDVAVDPLGEFVFVADTGADRILKFLTTGAFEDTVYSPAKIPLDPPMSAPRFLDTWDDLGTNLVYVADPENNRIVVLKLVRPL